ncbi:MAG TPA: hypothetical protein VKT51_02990 [Candidatus Eremiobacteraceae bacterium]|nr:hypothetical protein [Candidatus Eremiobacteraceae bacterium]
MAEALWEYGVLAGESKTKAWLDELQQVLNDGWELVHFGPYNQSNNIAIIRRRKE